MCRHPKPRAPTPGNMACRPMLRVVRGPTASRDSPCSNSRSNRKASTAAWRNSGPTTCNGTSWCTSNRTTRTSRGRRSPKDIESHNLLGGPAPLTSPGTRLPTGLRRPHGWPSRRRRSVALVGPPLHACWRWFIQAACLLAWPLSLRRLRLPPEWAYVNPPQRTGATNATRVLPAWLVLQPSDTPAMGIRRCMRAVRLHERCPAMIHRQPV